VVTQTISVALLLTQSWDWRCHSGGAKFAMVSRDLFSAFHCYKSKDDKYI